MSINGQSSPSNCLIPPQALQKPISDEPCTVGSTILLLRNRALAHSSILLHIFLLLSAEFLYHASSHSSTLLRSTLFLLCKRYPFLSKYHTSGLLHKGSQLHLHIRQDHGVSQASILPIRPYQLDSYILLFRDSNHGTIILHT